MVGEKRTAELDAAEGVATRKNALKTANAMDDRGYDAWMIEQQTKWRCCSGRCGHHWQEKKIYFISFI